MKRFWQWLNSHRPHLTKVTIVPAPTFEFKKGKRYLVFIDNTFMTKEEVHVLAKVAHNKGIESATFIVGRGDPKQSIIVTEDQ